MTADPIVYDHLTAETPWMNKLSPEAQEAVRRNVAQAPALDERQRERLRLLFRRTDVRGGTPPSRKAPPNASP
jgi:hypothetical protein